MKSRKSRGRAPAGIPLGVAILLVLSALFFGGTGVSEPGQSETAADPIARPTRTEAPARARVSPSRTPRQASRESEGIAVVAVTDLPPEVATTIELIRQDGPFPYSKDGSVFGNREGLLPRRSRGYYREYTVPTPGEDDRGARRIVAGQAGELYYTGDHYNSFVRIE